MMDWGRWIGLLYEANALKLMLLRNVLMVGIMFEVCDPYEILADGVLALRVLREAEMEYGLKDGLYLNTALMIVEQMNGLLGD